MVFFTILLNNIFINTKSAQSFYSLPNTFELSFGNENDKQEPTNPADSISRHLFIRSCNPYNIINAPHFTTDNATDRRTCIHDHSISDINPETGLKISEIESLGERSRSDVPILIAEDSVLLNKLIVDSLTAAGYNKIIHTENGQKAYDVIAECKADGTLDEHVKLVITDIEMPEMDGHRLTKLIKQDDKTKNIPVVIFSSLVNEEMKKKGEQLGADAQLSKPEIGNLVRIIDELVDKYKLN